MAELFCNKNHVQGAGDLHTEPCGHSASGQFVDDGHRARIRHREGQDRAFACPEKAERFQLGRQKRDRPHVRPRQDKRLGKVVARARPALNSTTTWPGLKMAGNTCRMPARCR